MKKLISVAAVLVLLFSLLTCTANAYTLSSDWTRMTGPADFSVSADGATVKATEGVSFIKYTKEPVDVTDFTCTFTLKQDAYYDYFGGTTYYYPIILANKVAHSGSQGLFLLLMPTSAGSLRVEGQILNTGFLLSPSYVEFNVDTTKPLTMHGKVIGDSTYQITFDGSDDTYVFEIPVNYQFQTDLDGVGYFAFGASSGGTNLEMTVTSINDLDFTGNPPTTTTTTTTTKKPTTTSTTAAAGNNGGGNDAPIGDSSSSSSSDEQDYFSNIGAPTQVVQDEPGDTDTLIVVLIVCVAVLALLLIAGAVLMVVIINKKPTPKPEPPAENPSEEPKE